MASIAPITTDYVPDLRDGIWAERIRAGDADAFAFVFRRLAPGLRAFVLRYVRSEQQAEDVVQDLFLTVWRRRETLALEVSLVTYLYAGARNHALNYLKHERVVRDWERAQSQLPPRSSPPTDEGIVEAELARRIQEAVDNLPERTRLVFTMSRQGKMKYEEIAEQLGVSVKTVETQMGRALRMMRGSLREFLT